MFSYTKKQKATQHFPNTQILGKISILQQKYLKILAKFWLTDDGYLLSQLLAFFYYDIFYQQYMVSVLVVLIP